MSLASLAEYERFVYGLQEATHEVALEPVMNFRDRKPYIEQTDRP